MSKGPLSLRVFTGGGLFTLMVLVSSNIYPRSCVLVCPPPQPGPSSGQPDCAMNSTQPFSFPNIKMFAFNQGRLGRWKL